MSRSKLHNKFMRKQWKGWSLFMTKADHPVRNEHRQDECPKNKPSKFISTRCSLSKVSWLQESTSFGGHKIPKGGHRKVSGIVRAKVREEVRREIVNELITPKNNKSYETI